MIARLQYITQDHPNKSHVTLCKEACEAGVKWVQLRMKNTTHQAFLDEAKVCRKITQKFDIQLIINDRLDIALEVNADGVHLGQDDMDMKKARKQAGERFIIGGTANTYDQVLCNIQNGVNYVGLGPYKPTSTKVNLSPILGHQGYKTVCDRLHEAGFKTPIIAVGGISLADIKPLMQLGIYGVAVSGLITHRPNPTSLIYQINDQLQYATTTNSRQNISI